jgi:hypothetical protein
MLESNASQNIAGFYTSVALIFLFLIGARLAHSQAISGTTAGAVTDASGWRDSRREWYANYRIGNVYLPLFRTTTVTPIAPGQHGSFE